MTDAVKKMRDLLPVLYEKQHGFAAVLLEPLLTEVEAEMAEVRDRALEEAAAYIEIQWMPDSYSMPCLVEFAKDLRAMKGKGPK